MMVTFLSLLAPIYFIVLGIEWSVGKLRNENYFRFSDAIGNMGCALSERLFDFFYAIIMLYIFTWVHNSFALFELPANPLMWLMCLIIYDFMYYWYHRTGHELNFLWAVHVSHHQSEEYNYTVAGRQSGFQAIARTFFLSVLPFIGFDPLFAWTVFIFGGTYQFFLHTKMIRNLGFLEHILVTPSLHRVHHGRNEQYLDKNYGGIFIFWDMLFGTYEREEDEVVYGITTGFESFNPYWAYFHYWVDLKRQADRIPSIKNKVRLLFEHPGWMPDGIELPKTGKKNDLNRPKYDPKIPLELGIYIFIQVVICFMLLSFMLLSKGALEPIYNSLDEYYLSYLSAEQVIVYSILVTFGSINAGVLIEKKKWVYYAEYIRLAMTGIAVPYILMDLPLLHPYATLMVGVTLAFGIWFYRMRDNYLDPAKARADMYARVQPVLNKSK